MLLAYDYPLVGLFWTMLWLYFVFAFIMVLFIVVRDIFRNHEMGGFAKAVWLLAVVLLPLIGTLVYALAHGDDLARRRAAEAKEQDDAMRTYVQEAAGTSGPADQIARLASLRDAGSISEAEFQAGKAKALA
jgi:heme exporter protein D